MNQLPSREPANPTSNAINAMALTHLGLFGMAALTCMSWYIDAFRDRVLMPGGGDPQIDTVSLLIEYLFSGVHLILAGFCACTLFGLVTAIGLFLRARWARIACLGIMWAIGLITVVSLAGFYSFVWGNPLYCRVNLFECRDRWADVLLGALIVFSMLAALICRYLYKSLRLLHSPAAREEFIQTSSSR